MTNRLTKAEFRQVLTWAYSLRGSCNRLHTATTLWSAEPEHRLLAAGYNGAPSGMPSCDESGHRIAEGHCVRTNHGEENALLNCRDFDRLRGGIATVLGTPCYPCARKLVSVGLRRVEYIGSYYNAAGRDLVEALFRETDGKSELVNIDIGNLVATLAKSIMFSKQSPSGVLQNYENIAFVGSCYPKGKFIVFEGPEGSGKSTQIKNICLYFRRKYGYDRVITTREPGGGIPQYRSLIFDIKKNNPNASAENLAQMELDLFTQDRCQHVCNTILPNIKSDNIVLCDRFAPSTIAYQGYGRGVDLGKIAKANAIATQGVNPDLVLLFDIDPSVGIARKHRNQPDELNQFDRENLDFHMRVRRGFLEQAESDTERWKIIDATQDEQTITFQIIDIIQRYCGL